MNFFLSKQTNPSIELTTLLANKTCENICKYPARYRFLSKKLDLNISFDHCDELEAYLKDSRGKSVSLVFASSFLGSPASYFGHTFISVNKEKNIHFSETFGYAAELPQSGNPFSLVIKGVSGQYNGRYVLAPYYQMLESYSVIEQRTLYEYTLDLNQSEIENMLWHSYELQNINVPYKFFTENCAYEVFWLIEVARPSISLRTKLKPYVIPYETIQVLKDEGMVLDHNKRQPLIEHLYRVYSTLNNDEKKLFSYWKESSNKEKELDDLNISQSTKNTFAELINGYYDILFKKNHNSKADFYDVKKIPFMKTQIKDVIDFEPRKPHKVSLGAISKNGNMGELLSFRPVLMDRFEERDSLLSESTLEFLNMTFSRVDNNTKLENFDIIKVESLNKRFDFYEPNSWRIYLGANRTFNDNSFSSVFEAGIGLTKGNDLFSAYGLVQMAIYPTQVSINLQALFGLSLWVEKGHLNFDYKESFANCGGSSRKEHLITFYYPLGQRFSIRVSNEFGYQEKRMIIDYKF
ncbi:DUF4105 domain-containing protein [Sulfuricurvum sp.]|uniref:Lnb N-terminal periplasmic domain-containing protein n=1 Tax=Sulfuricurvum sp. TaxID=2025608 RepID=UPI00286DF0B3|nr:DUF4105 domain-containing protein [Sulfuricurvum sp.]